MPDELRNSEMPYRTLGRTEKRVSAIGLGGWHIGLKHVDEALSLRIVREAIDRGINFMDNSWDYNEGASEVRMGKGSEMVIAIKSSLCQRSTAGQKPPLRSSSTNHCAGCKPTAST